MWRPIDVALYWLSGEWLLRNRANGGAVILVRALLIAVLLFLVGIGIEARLESGSTWRFDPDQLRDAIRRHLTWFTALFAGAYAALYTRFASQWTYLAGLYNHMMATQAKSPRTLGSSAEEVERRRVYDNWMAAFVEDADNVHLAQKPLYAALIKDMLADANVRKAFVANTTGGATRLARLEKKVNSVVTRQEERWRRRAERDALHEQASSSTLVTRFRTTWTRLRG